jgi:hypothetical protein
MPGWAEGLIVGVAAFLLAELIRRLWNKTDLMPEKYATKDDVKASEARMAKALSDHQNTCAGPGWMKEKLEKVDCIDKKFARLLGFLEAKGFLEPERPHSFTAEDP